MKYQKMNEFILEFQERTRNLKMEKQKLFFKNHEMQEEIRKLNVEIQHQIIELSETQKLNQSLQQSNDDLRSRNGLMSRKEQERLIIDIERPDCYFFHVLGVYARPFRCGRGY